MVAAFCALPGLLNAANAVQWQPSMSDVSALERKLVLPREAEPLRSYARYYTGEIAGGRKIIRGYYLGWGMPGIYLKPSETEVMDGGCSVIAVVFDVQSARISGVACNGVA